MHPPRRAPLFAAAVVTLLAPTGLAVAAPAGQATPAACDRPVFGQATRADRAAAQHPTAFAAAARSNGRDPRQFRAEAAADPSLWLDTCGRAFFVEPLGGHDSPGDSPGETASVDSQGAETAPADTATPTALRPLSETFLLESRPGATRTLFLDFRGGTVTGTGWNQTYGSTITAEPFTRDTTVSTSFSDAELLEIQRAWQVVAEDYAPFQINVTTRDLGADAITRSSSTDQVYGTRVMVTAAGLTPSGSMYASCSCGGVAYVNVFNLSGSTQSYYQPAWVFTNGTGTSGKNIGEAASHEAGHNFGLSHDGTSTSGYYTGSAPWAPVMGASYSQPLSQWSRGEYPGASNTTQDDLAVIAGGAPLRSDDVGGTAATAAPLTPESPRDAVIGTRADVDAFTFTAAGATSLAATPAEGLPNLDLQLTVTDAAGSTVAVVNPVVSRVSSSSASGLGATWTTTLPGTPATYTAYVDGVGQGDPATADGYSDYGSLGNYRISLTTDAGSVTPPPPAPATSVADQTLTGAKVGTAFAGQLVASGGDGSYTWSVGTGVPAGLTVSSSGAVTGTPTTAGTFTFAATATSAGTSATGTVTVTVASNVSPLTLVTTSLPSGKVKRAYTATISTSGGAPAYTWAVSGTLPAGLALTPSTDGRSAVLSGTPTTKAKYSFTVTVTDGLGTRVSRKYSVTISR